MCRYWIFFVAFFWSVMAPASSQPYFPTDMTLPGQGRASFKGAVIAPACTLAMEDTWQEVEMGNVPVRDLQNSFSGPEKRFRLRLHNCELASVGGRVYTTSRIRVTFDGVQGDSPDKFLLTGQAKGINLQIRNSQGYSAQAGEAMPPLLLNGDEDSLNYTLYIVRNGQPLTAGDYYAALRFKVDYE